MFLTELRKNECFAENNKKKEASFMVLSRAECIERYGSDYLIQQKINAGELYRISKGIFSEQAYVPELAIMTYKYPKAVVTMNSAFYHYGLTDVIPDRTDLATDRDAPKITLLSRCTERRGTGLFIPYLQQGKNAD